MRAVRPNLPNPPWLRACVIIKDEQSPAQKLIMSIVSQSYFLETAGLFYMHLLDIPWLAQQTHIYAYI